MMTPKNIAKKQFESFKKVIDETDVSHETPEENSTYNEVTLEIIKYSPKGDKAVSYYDKLCYDYLQRIGYIKKN